MNQEDQHEKSLEVPKMGKYYDNSTLTLIAMNDKIGDNIDGRAMAVYYRNGYDQENDKVELTLTQALFAIKNRKRTEPLDGIYSILGLLPYGKEVKVSYSNNTPEQALQDVMIVAIKNGYAEPLSWLGISNPKQGLCWMPQLDEYGSTSIMGSMGRVNSILKGAKILISFAEQGLEFTYLMPHYIIHKDNPQSIHKLESGFEIEGGLYRKEILVKPRDTKLESIKLSLLGTYESLKNAAKENILVVLYKEMFGTNKSLGLLVKKTEQENIYHRLGLVELVDSERIKFTTEWANFMKRTIIGTESQTQIEIPSK
ncbi:6246_t:CDS:2 [Funneliformis geosporum]|nr:6246_t:CDS:2 [Funneliformis geosporum]